MRAVYYGYFVMLGVSVLVGGFFWTVVALGGGGPVVAWIAPAAALLAGLLYTVEGLAMAFDWGRASSRFQAIREADDASWFMRFMTWVPSRMSFATGYRMVGWWVVLWGVILLGLFVVMLGYGAWR
jgi:hypothetical protein